MPRHFGMLIPSTNTTCEMEFCRLPPDLQVHTARLGKDGSTPFHRMTEASGVASLTSAQAIGRALHALGTLRIAMATPYSPEVIARAKHYYESKYGVSVIAAESLGATDSYTIGKMDAGLAQAAFSRIDRPDVDALVLPGGNFPTKDWIEPWERQFGKPVLTTNQAALWAVLRAMGIDKPLAGWGRLLAQMPTG
jgi:maleate isomerase